MYSAILIAREFINRAIKEGKPVTPIKLQKMLYIAQGLHLAYHNNSLINENIEAWKYGPVIPIVYNNFKIYGNQPITNPMIITIGNYTLDKPIDYLCDSAEEIINLTWDITKNVDGIQLSNWTHNINSPWDITFKESIGIENSNRPIPNESIKQYFIQTFEIETANNDTIATSH